MEFYIMLFLRISWVVPALFILWYLVSWAVHAGMTKNECTSWNFGSYQSFSREISKRDWKRRQEHPKSFFDKMKYSSDLSGSYVHADIVRFDGQGMILYPWSYWSYRSFLRKNSLGMAKRDKSIQWG